LEITHIAIASKKIKQNIMIALVSDIHDTNCDGLLSVLYNIKPDLILMPGDILDYPPVLQRPHQKNSFHYLKEAAGVAPSFMSIGNHEGFLSSAAMISIKETGVCLLDNQDTIFSCGNQTICIGGLSSPCGRNQSYSRWYTPIPDLPFLDRFSVQDGYKILLSHHPEYYPRYIRPRNIDLTLSGHAHGGQIRFLGQGIFSPGQGLLPKYTSGLYDNRLVVSRGLGNKPKLPRLFNPTQLIIIHLHPKG